VESELLTTLIYLSIKLSAVEALCFGTAGNWTIVFNCQLVFTVAGSIYGTYLSERN
jgi:hypothetical protein